MSGGGGGGRKRRGHEEEEHENHERWLVTYADMVTLLMVLFIVLFAISQVDQKKFNQLKTGIAAGFNSSAAAVTIGGEGVTEAAIGSSRTDQNFDSLQQVGTIAVTTPEQRAAAQAQVTASSRAQAQAQVQQATDEVKRLRELQARLQQALTAKGRANAAQYRITTDGLDVILVSDDLFFVNGSAELRPGGRAVLDAIGPVLAGVGDPLLVQGHANRLPISSVVYPSNWELSAGRAGSVVRYLTTKKIADNRLSATGYGSTRPLLPYSDPRALTVNRRVDILVDPTLPPAVKALLPVVAGAAPGAASTGLLGPATTTTPPLAARSPR